MANNTFSNLGRYYQDIQDAGNVMTSVPKTVQPIAPQPVVQKPVQQIPMPPVKKKTSPAIGLLLQQLLQGLKRRQTPSTPQIPTMQDTRVRAVKPTSSFGTVSSASQAREAMRRAILSQIQNQ